MIKKGTIQYGKYGLECWYLTEENGYEYGIFNYDYLSNIVVGVGVSFNEETCSGQMHMLDSGGMVAMTLSIDMSKAAYEMRKFMKCITKEIDLEGMLKEVVGNKTV